MVQHDQNTKLTLIFIDKEKFNLEVSQLTVRQLLELAKEDATLTTLASKHGNDLKKYTDLEETVLLENGMKFVIIHNEPTPVS